MCPKSHSQVVAQQGPDNTRLIPYYYPLSYCWYLGVGYSRVVLMGTQPLLRGRACVG